MSKKPEDDGEYLYLDLKYAHALLEALRKSGLTPEQGYVTLMFAARMLADANGVREETMINQFKSIELIEERKN
jgi:hypothetical protein